MSSIGVQVLHESGCYSDACLQQGDAWFMDETLSHEDAKKVVWQSFHVFEALDIWPCGIG